MWSLFLQESRPGSQFEDKEWMFVIEDVSSIAQLLNIFIKIKATIWHMKMKVYKACLTVFSEQDCWNYCSLFLSGIAWRSSQTDCDSHNQHGWLCQYMYGHCRYVADYESHFQESGICHNGPTAFLCFAQRRKGYVSTTCFMNNQFACKTNSFFI